jgi:hypothetical protein
MHSYHHSGHSGNRGRGNDSSRASLTAAGEPKVARVSLLLGNGVFSLQHHRGAPQDPGPVAAPEMRPNGPKLQCSLVAQGELERPPEKCSQLKLDAEVGCTRTPRFPPAEMRPAGNSLVPLTAPYIEASFGTALTFVAASTVRPVQSPSPERPYQLRQYFPPLADIWPQSPA